MSGLTGTWGELLYKNAAVGATVNTFTTEATTTILNTTATMGPQAQIPANLFLQQPQSAARTLRVVARGVMSTFTSGTWTVNLRGSSAAQSISGAVLLGTPALFTPAFSLTNVYWEMEGLLTLSVPGPTALSTIRGFGKFQSAVCAGAAAPYPNQLPCWAGNASPGTVATFDTTIPNWLTVSVANSVSNSANSITLEELEVYGLN